MAFFKHSTEVLAKMHSYEKFSSLSSYLTLPATRIDAEESEFSHYYFSDEESFTFLTVEGMVDSYDTVFVSDYGVFYTPLQKPRMSTSVRQRLAKMVHSSAQKDVEPSFSEDGLQRKARVFVDGRYYEGGLWFDKKYATFIETGWSVQEREQKTYFMRQTPGGPILQRMEPRDRHLKRDRELQVDESLYKHWQAEKHNGKQQPFV